MANENIKIIRSQQPEYLEVLALRQLVLRQPLGLNIYEEDLTSEIDTHIFIYSINSKIIACLLAFPLDYDTIKLRQMAVYEDFRGMGIGQELMLAAESFIYSKGYTKIVFHARASAISFYEKLGFKTTGTIFEEVTLPHIKMYKNL